jgi:hypothetical protein
MFEKLRQSLDELLARATRPEERSAVLARMKDALVHARVGVDDVRSAVETTRHRLKAERLELETIVRRKTLAQGIADTETVAVAERYERQHAERVRVLEAKLAAQEAELALAEQEAAEMAAELKRAAAGLPTGAPGQAGAAGAPGMAGTDPDARAAAEVEELLDDQATTLRQELDGMARAGRRAQQAAEADARLAELKRRMGK